MYRHQVALIFQLHQAFKMNSMKSYYKILLVVGFIFSILFSCDEIEDPFIEMVGECGDASLPVPIKQILIEEFTGHQCGNCPRGDEMMHTLKELYCDHIIPVSIHAGAFAELYRDYTYEYRTEDGNAIEEYFGGTANGVPGAMLNRTKFNDTYAQAEVSSWLNYADSLIKLEPVIDILIDTRVNNETRDINIDIDIVFIKSTADDLMLSLYFVEDSIFSLQKNYDADPVDVENYAHNHVLRDAINGVWGDQILTGNISSGDVVSKSYSYKVNSNWLIKNSSIIAFVYQSNSKEILQASQTYLY